MLLLSIYSGGGGGVGSPGGHLIVGVALAVTGAGGGVVGLMISWMLKRDLLAGSATFVGSFASLCNKAGLLWYLVDGVGRLSSFLKLHYAVEEIFNSLFNHF